MLLKLTDGEPIAGRTFKKWVVKKMVQFYRKANPNSLRYAHYSVEEILKLCVENKILPKTVLTQIKKSPNGHEYGVKVYLGNHVDADTYDATYSRYFAANTTIICNTEMITTSLFLDLLDDTKESAFLMPFADPGDGIDQATICPPDCPPACLPDCPDPEPDPEDGYDVGRII